MSGQHAGKDSSWQGCAWVWAQVVVKPCLAAATRWQAGCHLQCQDQGSQVHGCAEQRLAKPWVPRPVADCNGPRFRAPPRQRANPLRLRKEDTGLAHDSSLVPPSPGCILTGFTHPGSPAAGVEAQLKPEEAAAGVPKMLPAAALGAPKAPPKAPPRPEAWLEAGEVRLKPPVLPPKPGVWPKAKVLLEAGAAPKGWLAVAPKVGSPKPAPGTMSGFRGWSQAPELAARPGRGGLVWCGGCSWHPRVMASAGCRPGRHACAGVQCSGGSTCALHLKSWQPQRSQRAGKPPQREPRFRQTAPRLGGQRSMLRRWHQTLYAAVTVMCSRRVLQVYHSSAQDRI